jgi:hypothetical protein
MDTITAVITIASMFSLGFFVWGFNEHSRKKEIEKHYLEYRFMHHKSIVLYVETARKNRKLIKELNTLTYALRNDCFLGWNLVRVKDWCDKHKIENLHFKHETIEEKEKVDLHQQNLMQKSEEFNIKILS